MLQPCPSPAGVLARRASALFPCALHLLAYLHGVVAVDHAIDHICPPEGRAVAGAAWVFLALECMLQRQKNDYTAEVSCSKNPSCRSCCRGLAVPYMTATILLSTSAFPSSGSADLPLACRHTGSGRCYSFSSAALPSRSSCLHVGEFMVTWLPAFDTCHHSLTLRLLSAIISLGVGVSWGFLVLISLFWCSVDRVHGYLALLIRVNVNTRRGHLAR